MRFLILVGMMFACVGSAVAGVTIELVPSSTEALTAYIVYTVDGEHADEYGGSLIAGLAIEVSVDRGIIETVTPAKVGVSELGDEGYGVFMSTIIIEDGEIKPSSPAAIGAPDYPGQPGTDASCVLEFGALWDQRPAEAMQTPPLATGVLCTITVSESCCMTIGGNALRGKAVMIGGASIADADITYIGGDCWGWHCDCCWGPEDCAEAESVGCPESWCRAYQRCGDADGEQEVLIETPSFTLYTPVGANDVAALIKAYRRPLGAYDENLACDFDHQKEVLIETPTFTLYTRVGYRDVAILINYYRRPTGQMPASCDPWR